MQPQGMQQQPQGSAQQLNLDDDEPCEEWPSWKKFLNFIFFGALGTPPDCSKDVDMPDGQLAQPAGQSEQPGQFDQDNLDAKMVATPTSAAAPNAAPDADEAVVAPVTKK